MPSMWALEIQGLPFGLKGGCSARGWSGIRPNVLFKSSHCDSVGSVTSSLCLGIMLVSSSEIVYPALTDG